MAEFRSGGFMKKAILGLAVLTALAACGGSGEEGESKPASASSESVLGRWDVTVTTPDVTYPSWFELKDEGGALSGRFVGRFGSARPIASVEFSAGKLVFSLPSQYEQNQTELHFEGELKDGRLAGTTNGPEDAVWNWVAVPAPALSAPAEPEWGEPIQLLADSDLTGWKLRFDNTPNMWKVEGGVLTNQGPGTDLITEQKFENFKLHAEFMYPKGSNSGIYLRGRYEVQVEDGYGKEPESHLIGGLYGFLTPSVNAAKPAGEWQTYDITLLGRTVTVELNGEKVIDAQEIPGITGGALESDEGAPGPIMLQGDHGVVSFRNLTLTPAK